MINGFKAFLLAFLSMLFLPLFCPSIRLAYFAPFLAITFYRGSLFASLWKAVLAGLSVDLFSNPTFFGESSLNYVITTFILYPHTRHFFQDNLTTLPLVTFLFSILSCFLQIFLLFFLGHKVTLELSWILYSFTLLPLLDALYGFAVFSFPFQLYKKFRKKNA